MEEKVKGLEVRMDFLIEKISKIESKLKICEDKLEIKLDKKDIDRVLFKEGRN